MATATHSMSTTNPSENFAALFEESLSRQEMRLAHAVAGQAAVAVHNAKVFAQLLRSDEDVVALRRAVESTTTSSSSTPA